MMNDMNDLPMRKNKCHEWPTNEEGWMTWMTYQWERMNEEWPTNEKGWMTWMTYQWKRMNDIPWEMNDMNNLPMRKDKCHEWPTNKGGWE